MRAARTRLLGLALLALLCVGASCGSRHDPARPTQGSGGSGAGSGSGGGAAGGGAHAPPSGDRVTELESVDTSDLASSERRIWVDLINDMLSPCGDPSSVGRCASAGGSCRQCVPAARYLARLVAEGYERSEIEEIYQSRYGQDTRFEIDTGGAPVRGAPMAPITIVEFSDFQCPYCGAAHPVLREILREFEGRVRIIFKEYPLDGHARAMPAARAAVAAQRQGKFWEMHDLLFENQHDLEDADLDRYAQQLGLDMNRFHADLRSPDVQHRIDTDKAEGHRVGVEGTPTIFVNGRKFREPPQALASYIREELDQ